MVEVDVVTKLAAFIIFLSAMVLLLDHPGRSDERREKGVRALLFAHVAFIAGAAGLEVSKFAPFSISSSLLVGGPLIALAFGYIGLRALLTKTYPKWSWAGAIGLVALAEIAIIILSQSPMVAITLSSGVSGCLAAYLGWDLRRRGALQRLRAPWVLVLPFWVLSVAYLVRFAMAMSGASTDALAIATAGLGLLYPMTASFWVFGAIALRGHHLTRELNRAANYDTLTGLENRTALARLQTRFPDVERRKGFVSACLCVDLDHFKTINDSHGHAAGDAVLIAVADRMRNRASPADRIFRIGGDEFIIWRQTEPSEDLDSFVQALLEDLRAPIPYGGIDLSVGASIGLEVSNAEVPPSDLIRRADIALYHSKALGRHRVTRYSHSLGSAHDSRLTALNEVKDAVERGQIIPNFQPQIDLATGAVSGCEALARWHHPTRGILRPKDFLELADELDVLDELDRIVLDHAVRAQAEWADAGIPVPRLSVNVSASRLGDPRLFAEIQQRMSALPGPLSFEVLETAFVERDRDLEWNVDRLRDIGVGIEVDDFGTGHASLTAVLAMRPDRIKIDPTFVAGATKSKHGEEILATLIELCHKAGAASVVEGVETEEQVQLVRRLGAVEAQGFAFAKPMDSAEMTEWLRNLGANGRPQVNLPKEA